MTGNAIEVEAVSKRYLLGVDADLRQSFRLATRRALRQPADPRDEIWPLRDVTFEVREGQALGVIGRNGAGKSTLLKVLSRITEPTLGVSRTRGRVGALLEVGTGFHPELTGRENVFLSAAVLGMRTSDVKRRFSDIVEFSGIGRFLDTPVKRYSSGMYLRLAFAVAAHLEPDILLVDEVLAVGDAEFQRKCLGKMSATEQSGRTIVFVSHNLEAINRLCPTCVWIDEGRIREHGPTATVTTNYLASSIRRVGRRTFPDRPEHALCLLGAAVLGADGEPGDVVIRNAPFTVEVRVRVREDIPGLDLGFDLKNLHGTRVLDEGLVRSGGRPLETAGDYTIHVVVPPILRAGDYVLSVWAGSAYDDSLLCVDEALTFRLDGSDGRTANGLVDLALPWRVQSDSFDVAVGS